ncbi:MAG: hypothetical protein FJ148_10800 [Deltaproteobacteria bacterium]|nr:hypothetical protein [Deltaproteobacteria bacterium]
MRINERTGNRWLVLVAAVAVGLTLAGAAFAERRPGGDGGQRGPRGGRGIDPACASECGARECIRTVQQELRSCLASTCPAEHEAAEAACAGGRSDACKAAREALRSCGEPCREELQGGRQACREEAAACSASCPRIDAEGKDRACVRDCVGDGRECVAPAHEELKEGRAGCADLRDAVREACSADRDSDACTSARADLESCVGACHDPFLAAASECFSGTQACVAACPAATE